MANQHNSRSKTDLWDETLRDLRLQVTQATYTSWLSGTKLIHIQERTTETDLDLYTVEASSSYAVDWLENRLCNLIENTLSNILGYRVRVNFIAKEIVAYPPLDEPPDEDEEILEPDLEIEGAYHDIRNAIIQPSKVEVHSQYFRKKWRPLLGPTVSELIRELRQRCHYRSGRNSFQTDHQSLANTLGVSKRTIQRIFRRRKSREFIHPYLGYFIKEMKTQKESDGKTIKNIGTKFIIYLDEPLTPEDQKKVAELMQQEEKRRVNDKS